MLRPLAHETLKAGFQALRGRRLLLQCPAGLGMHQVDEIANFPIHLELSALGGREDFCQRAGSFSAGSEAIFGVQLISRMPLGGKTRGMVERSSVTSGGVTARPSLQ